MSDVALSETQLRLERLIPVPPERVFELWTDPRLLAQWWGPEGYQVPTVSLDVRPGGTWRTTMRNKEGTMRTVSGVYRAVEKPRRLVMSWAWHDDKDVRGHETEIIVTFEPAPGGTRLVLLQQQFQTKTDRDQHNFGWSSTFDKLTRLGT